MSNSALIRRAAEKGFLGHEALLDPDAFVTKVMPQQSELGPMVAQAETNGFGMADRLKVSIPKEPKPESPGTSERVRTKEQADLNYRLLMQGKSPEQVQALEQQASN